ncbi:LVIVD repeat-containing protein [Cesiribacter andamanensis]|uniref:LVIVD repeat protein n=1 Tax=Cesiribacter andamanensis AMV16 TaxID=1279009 RepID=M7NBD7_9BACT|nr:hypothetical protein [Cesiribacter andamanensis]EMR04587.1 hypothetical protein ADICEAN_00189 [Cesiribacter andamanensis AMV16]
MNRPTNFLLALLLVGTFLTGCMGPDEDEQPFREYYRPVYAAEQLAYRIQVQPARTLQNPGRIYVKDHLLIINERFKGFHLIDNSDPANPQPLLFLEVPGAGNMAMQGSFMYVDNMTDLLTLDLSNLQDIREVNRQKGVFDGRQNYPPMRNVAFECVDPKRGVVVGWEKADMPGKGYECFR